MTECKDEHILNSIDYPEDLRKLSPDKLGEVCAVTKEIIKKYKTKLYNKKLTIKCITKLKAHKNTSIVYKIETDKE